MIISVTGALVCVYENAVTIMRLMVYMMVSSYNEMEQKKLELEV